MPWFDNSLYASAAAAGMIALAGDLAGDGSAALTPRVGTLTGVSSVVAVRDAAALAFIADETVTGVATTGDLRFRHGRTNLAIRNLLDTGNITVISTDNAYTIWGHNTENVGSYYRAQTFHQMVQGGVVIYTAISSSFRVDCGIIAITAGTVAAAGNIRAPNNTTILAARNAANSADINLVATDGSNNTIWGNANVNSSYYLISSGGTHEFQTGGGARLRITTATVAIPSGTVLTFGSSVATSGDIRGNTDFSIKGVASGVSDFNMLSLSSGTSFTIGGNNANVTVHQWTTGTASTIGMGGGSANRLSISSTLVTVGANIDVVIPGAGTASTAGNIRFGTITNRILVGVRNSDNNANIAAIAVSGGAEAGDSALYFGTDSAFANQSPDTYLGASAYAAIVIGSTARIQCDTTGIGFFGEAAIARPDITGSRGGNAALASLLSQLDQMGLVTDSTTA